jgi:hypothetical protein
MSITSAKWRRATRSRSIGPKAVGRMVPEFERCADSSAPRLRSRRRLAFPAAITRDPAITTAPDPAIGDHRRATTLRRPAMPDRVSTAHRPRATPARMAVRRQASPVRARTAPRLLPARMVPAPNPARPVRKALGPGMAGLVRKAPAQAPNMPGPARQTALHAGIARNSITTKTAIGSATNRRIAANHRAATLSPRLDFGIAPAAVAGDQRVGLLRPPAAARIGDDPRRRVE